MYKYLLAGLLLLPNISFASVSISEIAWMGTQNSGSDEWIELYNDGSEAISLSGYSLVTIDDKLKISLKGEIKPNSYYLIERTDDTTVSNVTADLVASFGSGLSNTGETLRILDENGSVVDEVISGSDWKNIGGNSETKETAQKVGAIWITAVATPRQAGQSGENTSTNTTENTTALEAKTSSSQVKKVKNSNRITITNDGNVVKDIPEKFTARFFDTNGDEIKFADIKWNFGDGATAKGNDVDHTYRFEGTYQVVLIGTYYDKKVEEKLKINVLGQDLKIVDSMAGNNGYIKIRSNIDTDISGYSIVGGNAKYVFPEGTLIYAKTPAIFANMYTGIVVHNPLVLQDGYGKILTAAVAGEAPTPTRSYSYGEAINKSKPADEEKIDSSSSSSLLLASAQNIKGMPNWVYFAVSIFFISVIGVIIFASRVFNKDRELEDEVKKYTLVEIDSNLE